MKTARAFDDRDDRPSGQVLAFCFDESFNFFPHDFAEQHIQKSRRSRRAASSPA